jgi:hypothetical protein
MDAHDRRRRLAGRGEELKEIVGKWRTMYTIVYDNKDFYVLRRLDFEMPTGKYFVQCKECGIGAPILGGIPALSESSLDYESAIRPRSFQHLPECSWSRE